MTSRPVREPLIVTDDALDCLPPTPVDAHRPLYDGNSRLACDDVVFLPAHTARQLSIFGGE